MSEAIDRLAIEIDGDSSAAVASLDRLAISLGKVKEAVSGGAGLNPFAKKLHAIRQAVSGLDTEAARKLTSFAEGLRELGGVSDLKISSTISKQITEINTAVNGLDGGFKDKVAGFADSLRPLSAIGKSNLTSTLNSLKKIPEIVKSLDSSTLTEFSAKLREVTEAVKPLADEMNKVSAGFSAFPAKIQKLIGGNQQTAKSTGVLGTGISALTIRFAAAWAVARRFANTVGDWISSSNKYIEDLNLFNASLGEYATKAQEYAEKVGEVMGIDPAEWMRNQGVFQTLITGFGVVSDRAVIMSKNLTQLGYDLSSFFNISFADSMQKLQSGIAGELEPLRRLGFDLSKAKLEAIALSLGIDKAYRSMSQAEKSQLRYYAIMTQVTVAQGDMARTLNAPANQLRILQSQATQAARALGNIFIPALNRVLPYAIAFIKIIRWAAQEIANLFGFTLPEVDYTGITDGAGAVDDLTDGIDAGTEAAERLKHTLAGFDEINLIATQSGGSGGSGSGGGGAGNFDFELPEYDFLGDLVNSKTTALFESWKKGLKPIMDWIVENFDSVLACAMAIGAALLAWKISTSIAEFFGMAGGLWKAGVFGIALAAEVFFAIEGGTKFAQGKEAEGLLETILGIFVGGIGGAVLTGSLAAGFAIALPVGLGLFFVAEAMETHRIRVAAAKKEMDSMYGAIVLTEQEAINLAKTLLNTPFFAKIGLAVANWDKAEELSQEIRLAQQEADLQVLRLKMGLDDPDTAASSLADSVRVITEKTLEKVKQMNLGAAITLEALFGEGSDTAIAGTEVLTNMYSSIEAETTELANQYYFYLEKALGDGEFTVDEQKTALEIYSSWQKAINMANGMMTDTEITLALGKFRASELTKESYDLFRTTVFSQRDEMFENVQRSMAATEAQLNQAVEYNTYKYNNASEDEKEYWLGEKTKAENLLSEYINESPMIVKQEEARIDLELSNTFYTAFQQTWGELGLDRLAANELGQTHITWEVDENDIDVLGAVGASQKAVNAFTTEFDQAAKALIAQRGGVDSEWYQSLTASLSDSYLAVKEDQKVISSAKEAGKVAPMNVLQGIRDYNMAAAITGDLVAQAKVAASKALTDPAFLEALATTNVMGQEFPEGFVEGLYENIDSIVPGVDGAFTLISNGIEHSFPKVTQELFDNFALLGIDLRNYVTALPPEIDTSLADGFKIENFAGSSDAITEVSNELSNSLVIDPSPATESITDTTTGMQTALDTNTPNLLSKAGTFISGLTSALSFTAPTMNLSNLFSGLASVVSASGETASGFSTNISTILGGLSALAASAVNAVTSGSGISFSGTIGSWVGSIISGISFFADGGFPTMGQLFLARENGPEMVGTMGGHSAVANNDQIVEGIASGVAEANSEQNTLLRQQNALLAALLEKENSVALYPTAALGKVVNRAQAMQAQLAGGVE